MNVSWGIMCHNEEANIGSLLRAAMQQHNGVEITVVASGCTDRTVEIAESFPVNILVQEHREGKASAINLFIRESKGDVLVVESGDTIPADGCLEALLKPFQFTHVGMTGAHPVPVDAKKNFKVKYLWELHHRMALKKPKMGEMIAFRRLFDNIPEGTAVDEASIEFEVSRRGYSIRYCPDAIVYNKGPETVSEFIKQRKRIYLGHLALREQGYDVSSMGTSFLVQLVVSTLRPWNLHGVVHTVWLEYIARRQAGVEFKQGLRASRVWEQLPSTKKLSETRGLDITPDL